MDFKDYYATLGVKKDATQEEIQKAYKKLARKFHPDVNKDPAAEAKFKDIGEANEVLKDPEKRARYDQYGSAWNSARQTGAPPPGWDGVRFDFDGAGGRGFDFGGGGADGFSSFFDMLFGSGAGRRGGGFPGGAGFPGANFGAGGGAGADSEAALPLTLEEAFRGGSREITFADGATGERKTLSVRIPPGVRSGQKIRLAGQGQAGRGGAAGDLFLKIDVLPDPRFRIEGMDLYTTVPVTPWEAALGGEAEVGTLDGAVRVRVPAGSSSGRKIRLRGKGLVSRNGGSPGSGEERGDLIAEMRIVLPETLSDRERELFQELAETSEFRPRED